MGGVFCHTMFVLCSSAVSDELEGSLDCLLSDAAAGRVRAWSDEPTCVARQCVNTIYPAMRALTLIQRYFPPTERGDCRESSAWEAPLDEGFNHESTCVCAAPRRSLARTHARGTDQILASLCVVPNECGGCGRCVLYASCGAAGAQSPVRRWICTQQGSSHNAT